MQFSQYDPSQVKEVAALFAQVFGESEGAEKGDSVGALAFDLLTNNTPADVYAFTARDDGELLACVAFSRMRFESGINAFMLSPMAVASSQQGQGLGQELITYAINVLKAEGVELLVSYGDPNFYSRVGFQQVSTQVIPAPFELSLPHGWIAQSLVGDSIEPQAGEPRCVSAFDAPEHW